jgi:hypothetical protein
MKDSKANIDEGIFGEIASTFFETFFVREGVVSMHRHARRCAALREGFSAGR